MHPPPSAAARTVPSKSSHEARPKSHRNRVAILGATGSIGTSAIDVCRHLTDRFEIHSLTAVTSWKKLAEQALEIRPKMVALNDKSTAHEPSDNLKALHDALLGTGIELITGPHAMEEIARSSEFDTVVAAVVGATPALPPSSPRQPPPAKPSPWPTRKPWSSPAPSSSPPPASTAAPSSPSTRNTPPSSNPSAPAPRQKSAKSSSPLPAAPSVPGRNTKSKMPRWPRR